MGRKCLGSVVPPLTGTRTSWTFSGILMRKCKRPKSSRMVRYAFVFQQLGGFYKLWGIEWSQSHPFVLLTFGLILEIVRACLTSLRTEEFLHGCFRWTVILILVMCLGLCLSLNKWSLLAHLMWMGRTTWYHFGHIGSEIPFFMSLHGLRRFGLFEAMTTLFVSKMGRFNMLS